MVCQPLHILVDCFFDSPHLHASFDVAFSMISLLLLHALKVLRLLLVAVFAGYTSCLGVCLLRVFFPSQELITPAMPLRFLVEDCIIRH